MPKSQRVCRSSKVDNARKGQRAIILLALLGAAQACTEDSGPSAVDDTPRPVLVSLSPDAAVLSSVGESRQIVATVIDQHGDTMSDPAITWLTADSAIADISPTGLVTARGPGAVRIDAIAGFATARASVHVQTASVGTLQPLVVGLEYPTGLWVSGGSVFVTETAGHNTSFGGAERLVRYSIDSEEIVPLLDTWADAVAVSGDGTIYLASWRQSIPGEVGMVTTVDPATLVETHLLDLGVAATDLFVDADDDMYVAGTSREPSAPSLSLLPAGDRTGRVVLEQGQQFEAVTRIGSDSYLSRFGDGTNPGARTIVRRTDGGTITELVDDVGAVSSLTSDGTNLYFAALGGGWIGRFDPLAASPVIDTIASGLVDPMAIRYDSATESLYFVTGGTSDAEYRDGTLGVITGVR